MNWIIKFLKHPREIGSLAPSSNALCRLMTQDISSDARVLELGPGNGAITQHLIERLDSPSQLIGIEYDADFASICQQRFPSIQVVHGDMFSWLGASDQRFDAIVSGIPFSNITLQQRLKIFRSIADHLTKDGQFILFQYSPRIKRNLLEIFQITKTGFVPWNIPPALVYTCRKRDRVYFSSSS